MGPEMIASFKAGNRAYPRTTLKHEGGLGSIETQCEAVPGIKGGYMTVNACAWRYKKYLKDSCAMPLIKGLLLFPVLRPCLRLSQISAGPSSDCRLSAGHYRDVNLRNADHCRITCVFDDIALLQLIAISIAPLIVGSCRICEVRNPSDVISTVGSSHGASSSHLVEITLSSQLMNS